MNDQNPYTTPDASLQTGHAMTYQPRVLSFNGRIGRMRYLAYGISVNLLLAMVMVPVVGAAAAMGEQSGGAALTLGVSAILYLFIIVISIMFSKRRLNDLNRSGWWFLLTFVPFANLALAIYLIFFPGTDGPNNWGPEPVANSIGVLILGWAVPAIALVGIAAAILIPQLAGMGP